MCHKVYETKFSINQIMSGKVEKMKKRLKKNGIEKTRNWYKKKMKSNYKGLNWKKNQLKKA